MYTSRKHLRPAAPNCSSGPDEKLGADMGALRASGVGSIERYPFLERFGIKNKKAPKMDLLVK